MASTTTAAEPPRQTGRAGVELDERSTFVSNRCIGRMHTTKHPAFSSFRIPPSVQGEPAATKKNKAKQNDDVKDRELWVPPDQKVLQNGNAECRREQSRVEACEKANCYKRRTHELHD